LGIWWIPHATTTSASSAPKLKTETSLPGYDGDRWVALHDYQGTEWKDIIDPWQVLNEHLLRAATAIFSLPCFTGASKHPFTHRLKNVGTTEFHTLNIELCPSEESRK
jgi:hypothetical protein